MHGEHHNQQPSSHFTYQMDNHQVEMEHYNKNYYQYLFENSLDLKLLYENITTFWIPGNEFNFEIWDCVPFTQHFPADRSVSYNIN